MSAEVTPIKRCRVCSSDARDAPQKGPYANLCAGCRKDRGAELGALRKAEHADRSAEARSLDDALAKLKAACRRLGKAVAQERSVKQERQMAVSDFNAAIRAVNEQARKVLNSPIAQQARVEERLERELAEIEAANGDTPAAE